MHYPAPREWHHISAARKAPVPTQPRRPAPQSPKASHATHAATSLDYFDFEALRRVEAACAWDDEEGQRQRRRLWRSVDAPTSNGMVSKIDVDLWVRRILGCADDFASRPAVHRIFEAAKEQTNRTSPHYIVPGAEFWRVVLLLRCYLRAYADFLALELAPSGRGAPHASSRPSPAAAHGVDLERFRRFAGVFSRLWGVPLTDERAQTEFARIDHTGTGTIRFDELCCWAVVQLIDGPVGGLRALQTPPAAGATDERASSSALSVEASPRAGGALETASQPSPADRGMDAPYGII